MRSPVALARLPLLHTPKEYPECVELGLTRSYDAYSVPKAGAERRCWVGGALSGLIPALEFKGSGGGQDDHHEGASMERSEGALFRSRLASFAGTGVVCVGLACAAGAQAQVSPPPIPGTFVYHETNTPDGRCSSGYGFQFAPLPGVSDYSYTYFDGYYNSDAGATETSAEFRGETYSTPSLYFHGITGGTGPQPCTADGNDDGGRFPQPPTIYPSYPDGKNPPLAKAKSSSRPISAGKATLQAASGTFPVNTTATVDIVLKSQHPLTGFKISHLHASNRASVVQQPEDEALGVAFPAHSPQTFTAQVDGKHAGRVTLNVTFTGRYTPEKSTKAKKVTFTASSSLLFGN
jgi:hypothetical protein